MSGIIKLYRDNVLIAQAIAKQTVKANDLLAFGNDFYWAKSTGAADWIPPIFDMPDQVLVDPSE